jgi:UDP-N-acetylmuramyl tripeptide synthase
MNLVLIILGKVVIKISQLLNLGSGSTWPGHIALKFNSKFIENVIAKNKNLKIIVVAGTNGKTTTTSLLKFLLENFGYKVFSNQEGANLLNGIASSLIKNSNFIGKLNVDYAIFEVDEFVFPNLLEKITPQAIIILNLFRDQLDRYGEVNTIVLKWQSALKKLPQETHVVLNGDDPQLYDTGQNLSLKVSYFGVDRKLMKLKNIPHDVDFIYCPKCFSLLNYRGLSFAHLGDFYCPKCGFKNENIEDFSEKNINYPMEGLYNVYNTNAVLLLIKNNFKFDFQKINRLLEKFSPAFGRQEEIIYQGRKIFILLSKNPAGFNQSIKTIINKMIIKNPSFAKASEGKKKANFLILLNDRIPDGRDVSWIWDVDFQPVLAAAKNIFVSGDRVYDMTLRLKYENSKKKVNADEKLERAIEEVVRKTKKGERLFILTTYSAMLEVRKILLGRKLL